MLRWFCHCHSFFLCSELVRHSPPGAEETQPHGRGGVAGQRRPGLLFGAGRAHHRAVSPDPSAPAWLGKLFFGVFVCVRVFVRACIDRNVSKCVVFLCHRSHASLGRPRELVAQFGLRKQDVVNNDIEWLLLGLQQIHAFRLNQSVMQFHCALQNCQALKPAFVSPGIQMLCFFLSFGCRTKELQHIFFRRQTENVYVDRTP